MKLTFRKTIAIILTATITMTATVPAFAETKTMNYNIQCTEDSMGSLIITDEGVIINNTYYSRSEFTTLLYQAIKVEQSQDDVQTYAAIAAGIYFIPGIGEVAILATGVIAVAGVTIAARVMAI